MLNHFLYSVIAVRLWRLPVYIYTGQCEVLRDDIRSNSLSLFLSCCLNLWCCIMASTFTSCGMLLLHQWLLYWHG